MTDDAGLVNTIVFLLMGSGFLFSGVVIRKSDILPEFIWAYWASVPGLTTRALIANDLACCYIEVILNRSRGL